jgi:hypothetical protein
VQPLLARTQYVHRCVLVSDGAVMECARAHIISYDDMHQVSRPQPEKPRGTMYTYAFVCDHATGHCIGTACMWRRTNTHVRLHAWPLMHVNTQQCAQRVVFPRSQSMAACKFLLTWEANYLLISRLGYELPAVKGDYELVGLQFSGLHDMSDHSINCLSGTSV